MPREKGFFGLGDDRSDRAAYEEGKRESKKANSVDDLAKAPTEIIEKAVGYERSSQERAHDAGWRDGKKDRGYSPSSKKRNKKNESSTSYGYSSSSEFDPLAFLVFSVIILVCSYFLYDLGFNFQKYGTTWTGAESCLGGGLVLIIVFFCWLLISSLKDITSGVEVFLAGIVIVILVVATGFCAKVTKYGNESLERQRSAEQRRRQNGGSSGTMYINSKMLNVRKGAGTKYPVVRRAYKNEEIIIYGESVRVGNSIWRQSIGKGQSTRGWVNMKFIRKSK